MKFQYEELGLKARYAPRINLHNRTKLENVIPISTPYVIFVDTCDACNFKCVDNLFYRNINMDKINYFFGRLQINFLTCF